MYDMYPQNFANDLAERQEAGLGHPDYPVTVPEQLSPEAMSRAKDLLNRYFNYSRTAQKPERVDAS